MTIGNTHSTLDIEIGLTYSETDFPDPKPCCNLMLEDSPLSRPLYHQDHLDVFYAQKPFDKRKGPSTFIILKRAVKLPQFPFIRKRPLRFQPRNRRFVHPWPPDSIPLDPILYQNFWLTLSSMALSLDEIDILDKVSERELE